MPIQTHCITVTPLQENCYFVWDDETNEAVVVDPGGEENRLLAFARENTLDVRLILNTHGHIDHIGANAAMRRATDAPIGVHPIDAPMLESALLCGASWVGLPYEEHSPDFLIDDGDKVSAQVHSLALKGAPAVTSEKLWFEVTHVPGHSPGSVMFHMPHAGLVLSGDLVFLDGVGRWDLPGGDRDVLARSIVQKFLKLPNETRVLPGHGPETTVSRERKRNFYLSEFVAELKNK